MLPNPETFPYYYFDIIPTLVKSYVESFRALRFPYKIKTIFYSKKSETLQCTILLQSTVLSPFLNASDNLHFRHIPPSTLR